MSEALKIDILKSDNFRKQYRAKYAQLTPPVWKRAKINGSSLALFRASISAGASNQAEPSFEQSFEGKVIPDLGSLPFGLTITPLTDELLSNLVSAQGLNFESNRFGIDLFYPFEVYSHYNSGLFIHITQKVTEPLYIEFELDEAHPALLDFIIIKLEQGASANITVNYKSKADSASFYKNSVLKVISAPYSNLKLSRVQTLNTNSQNYDFTEFLVEERANVEYYTAEFGSAHNVTSSTAYLNGFEASIKQYPAYIADMERKVDLAFSIIFNHQKTTGEINGCGAIMHKASKVFRGNIYFEKGSKGSVGREGTFDILLDKTINSHAIPTLFCDEDDVIGEHYASIGKIDEKQLMYLMSRGISEELAKRILVQSSFRPILENIEGEGLKESLIEEINRRIK